MASSEIANPSTVYSLSLFSEYTQSLDTIPTEVSRHFGDLRELDAVLSSSIASLTTKIQTLTKIIEQRPKSSTPEERLWLLTEIAEEASRLKLGGEDKIRVACQAADGLNSLATHMTSLLERVPEFDPALLSRKTIYPHVGVFVPQPAPEGGRRRRGNQTSLLERSPRKDRNSEARARNAARNSRRAVSPAESMYSVTSHLVPQTVFPTSRNGGQTSSRAVNGSTSNNKRSRGNGPSTPPEYENSPLPYHSLPSSSSVPVAHPYTNGNGSYAGYDLAGEWIPPAATQLQGPGMPIARGVSSSADMAMVPQTNGTAVVDNVDADVDGDDTKTYCFCESVSYGEMIACDDKNCEREWFHLICIGLTVPPDGTWYCETCLAKRAKRAGRGGKRKTAGNRAARNRDHD